MNIINHILNMVFPEKCISCGKSNLILCQNCAYKLPRGFPPDKNGLVILDYSDKCVKRAIWLFKYRNKRSLAKIFAELANNSLLEELAELKLMKNFTDPLLVPMPISAKRFRERGYNQTELLAHELSLLGGFELNENALIKSRHTESQVKTQSKRERLENLKGSFVVKNTEAIRGRNIILLDDVITTGATMHEARSALKKAGAKNILSVALAH